MMDIVFGLWADTGAWPEHGGGDKGALGAPVVGPRGLLEILETTLGLGFPPAPEVVRIAFFQSVLESLPGGPRFWTRSLEVDGWATARTLLGWRDTLVDAGWRPLRVWNNPRLAELSSAIEAAAALPPGFADRLVAIEDQLEGRRSVPIKRIRLIDPRHLLPSGLRRLINAVEACGVLVETVKSVASAPASTALGRVQRWLASGEDVIGDPDGSLTFATGTSKLLAAEVVSQWFEANEGSSSVLIAQGGDTHLLDHALGDAGQARAGRSRPSPHRGSLQILLLAFKVAWRPFDPRALLELLLFPASPVAPRAAVRLAKALEKAPGRGGTEWQQAWRDIEAAELNACDGNSAALRKAHERLRRWRAWVEPTLADADVGMLLVDALGVCDRIIEWSTARAASTGDPLYSSTASLGDSVRQAFRALARDQLSRSVIERIIDQALDVGCSNLSTEAQAASWRSVLHPGAIWGPVDAVVWWDFSAESEVCPPAPWTAAERAELAKNGCVLAEPDSAAKAAAASWERAVNNARERLLFVASGLEAEGDSMLHPLAHRLAPATRRIATRIRLEEATHVSALEFAGTKLMRRKVPRASLPGVRVLWPTPLGFGSRSADLIHSATSFESGLSCQLMWGLRHAAKLRPGRLRLIPDANRLLGNLAHALANAIFKPGRPPEPLAAAALARDLLPRMIEESSAPLLLPEFATQLVSALEQLPLAMSGLARMLHENDLVVEASEYQVSALFADVLSVHGAVDLVARDRHGGLVIVDLKWTRSPKRRFDELKAGEAVQLATYGAMVGTDKPFRAGYYLLAQRQFATLAGTGLIGQAVEGVRDFTATWTALTISWRKLREAADAGAIVATGVAGGSGHLPVDLPLALASNCTRCDYQTLCRVRGLK